LSQLKLGVPEISRSALARGFRSANRGFGFGFG
jgi:hypothetical protein